MINKFLAKVNKITVSWRICWWVNTKKGQARIACLSFSMMVKLLIKQILTSRCCAYLPMQQIRYGMRALH